MNPEKPTTQRPRQFFSGIFSRALALSIVSIFVALGSFAFTIVKREQEMLMDDLEGRAKLLASSVDRVTGNSIVAEDNWAVVNQFQKIIEVSPEVRYTAVTKKLDGSSLVFTEKGWRQEEKNNVFWNPDKTNYIESETIVSPVVAEEVLHYRYPLSYEGYEWGWIHVGMGLGEYHEKLSGVYWIIVLLAIPGFLIGALFSFIFARRLTMPISVLREFAGKVAGGNLEERVEIDSKNELGDLAESLNSMTEDLGASLKREAELREKDVLLKEIHHRVKNNMQILTSLFRLQGRKAGTDELKRILKESESRIRSMGLIHEKLYQSESLSEINFESYVGTLAGELSRMYSETSSTVDLKIEVDDVHLGIDTALPCGLLINELVSNSLKYAFPDGRKGSVLIQMKPDDEPGRYHLVVSDDGIGAPEDGKLEREGSLGMRLIEMLTEQLNGTVQFSNGVGITADIHFYETSYTNRV